MSFQSISIRSIITAIILSGTFVLGATQAFAQQEVSFEKYDFEFDGPPYVPNEYRRVLTSEDDLRRSPSTRNAHAHTHGEPLNTGGASGTHPGQPAGTQQTPKEKLLFRLSGYEYFPSRQDLDEIGTPIQVEGMLIEIVKGNERPMHRMRAVDALGYYTSPQVIHFLDKIAHNPNGDSSTGAQLNVPERLASSLQHRAIVALGKAARHESVSKLQDLLAGDDVQLQLTVVTTLGKHAGLPGRQAIEAFVQSKPDPIVLEEARRYLQ